MKGQLLDFNILPTAHGRLGTIKVDVAIDEQTYPRTPNEKPSPKSGKSGLNVNRGMVSKSKGWSLSTDATSWEYELVS